MPVMTNRYLTTTEPIPYADARDLSTTFRQTYSEDSVEGQPRYTIRTSTEQVNESTASTFLLRTLMTYGAVVLMVTCFYHPLPPAAVGCPAAPVPLRGPPEAGGWRSGPAPSHHPAAGLLVRPAGGGGGLLRPGGGALLLATISTEITAYLGFSVLLPQVGAIAAILLLLLAAYYAATYTLFRRAGGVRALPLCPRKPGPAPKIPHPKLGGGPSRSGRKGRSPVPALLFPAIPWAPRTFPTVEWQIHPHPLTFPRRLDYPVPVLQGTFKQGVWKPWKTRNPLGPSWGSAARN